MTSRSFVLRYVFLFCLQWLFIYYTNLLILGIYLCRKNPKSVVTRDDASKYRQNAQLKYELVTQV